MFLVSYSTPHPPPNALILDQISTEPLTCLTFLDITLVNIQLYKAFVLFKTSLRRSR